MLKQTSEPSTHFTPEQVKLLCGGKFPHANGFCWSAVRFFVLEDGVLQPYEAMGDILPGPGFAVSTIPTNLS